ncbi:MAG: cobalamin biosynthesis protein CbiD [Deltaproteobacteria bacterium]|nr:cobalamin biosynthesis protein CbiD [Deltaproteobacteria bacterium]
MSALRNGFTTGSCAAAAAKAAVRLLAGGRAAERLEIPLPHGARCELPIFYSRLAGSGAEAAVRKDAGDDPDMTDGALIVASVAWNGVDDIEFCAGEGVGVVTKPGLAIPPGEPAINPVPRAMIREAIREVTLRGVRVTIAIPGGEEIARRTFNPRIGILGGLSILGTTGIVRPFSCSAIRETLRCSLSVADAAGIRAPVFVPGHIGQRAAREHFGVADGQIIEAGNEWGFVLDGALQYSFSALLIVGHPGKLAKLPAGDWDTHSGRSGSALPAASALHEKVLGRPAATAATVEGLFAALSAADKKRLGDALASAIKAAIDKRTRGRYDAAVVLIDLGGRIIGASGDLKAWSEKKRRSSSSAADPGPNPTSHRRHGLLRKGPTS